MTSMKKFFGSRYNSYRSSFPIASTPSKRRWLFLFIVAQPVRLLSRDSSRLFCFSRKTKSMSRKERTKIRRNNYRTWKQKQKQQRSAAPASSAAPTPSAEPASAAAPQVEQSKAAAPSDPKAPLPLPPGA